jgi:hypothetical protein
MRLALQGVLGSISVQGLKLGSKGYLRDTEVLRVPRLLQVTKATPRDWLLTNCEEERKTEKDPKR